MWSRVSIPRQGKGMWLLHPFPYVESKKRRRIEFTHLIIVKVDFHWHVIFACEHVNFTYVNKIEAMYGARKNMST